METEGNEKAKKGRPSQADKITELESRVEKLEAALSKIGTLTGNGNVLAEFGLKRWVPGKKDMSKYG